MVPAKTIGIDVGLKSFAVLSDGTEIENPKHLLKSESKLRRKQRELSRKKKGSANRKKARLIVAKLHRKVRNQRCDFHHKQARKLVDSCGFIVVEDLQIRNMVRNRHLSKSVSDAGWGGFLNKLAYKAAEAGNRSGKAKPHHTNVNCSRCGTAVPKTLSVRVHRCPACGLTLNRDHNAAINILQRSTAGTAGSYAWGEAAQSGYSLNQEATLLAAW